MAPSKTYNIAGLDLRVPIIQNEELRKTLPHAHHGLLVADQRDGQDWAAIAPYRAGERRLTRHWVSQPNRRLCVRNEKMIADIAITRLEATYLAWLDAAQGLSIRTSFFCKTPRVR